MIVEAYHQRSLDHLKSYTINESITLIKRSLFNLYSFIPDDNQPTRQTVKKQLKIIFQLINANENQPEIEQIKKIKLFLKEELLLQMEVLFQSDKKDSLLVLYGLIILWITAKYLGEPQFYIELSKQLDFKEEAYDLNRLPQELLEEITGEMGIRDNYSDFIFRINLAAAEYSATSLMYLVDRLIENDNGVTEISKMYAEKIITSNKATQEQKAKAHYVLGNYYRSASGKNICYINIPQAIIHYQAAIDCDNQNVIYTYGALGETYYYSELNYEKAIYYLNKQKKIHDKFYKAASFDDKIYVHHDLLRAKSFLLLAYQQLAINQPGYKEGKIKELAQEVALKCENCFDMTNEQITGLFGNFATFWLLRKDFDKAVFYAKRMVYDNEVLLEIQFSQLLHHSEANSSFDEKLAGELRVLLNEKNKKYFYDYYRLGFLELKAVSSDLKLVRELFTEAVKEALFYANVPTVKYFKAYANYILAKISETNILPNYPAKKAYHYYELAANIGHAESEKIYKKLKGERLHEDMEKLIQSESQVKKKNIQAKHKIKSTKSVIKTTKQLSIEVSQDVAFPQVFLVKKNKPNTFFNKPDEVKLEKQESTVLKESKPSSFESVEKKSFSIKSSPIVLLHKKIPNESINLSKVDNELPEATPVFYSKKYSFHIYRLKLSLQETHAAVIKLMQALTEKSPKKNFFLCQKGGSVRERLGKALGVNGFSGNVKDWDLICNLSPNEIIKNLASASLHLDKKDLQAVGKKHINVIAKLPEADVDINSFQSTSDNIYELLALDMQGCDFTINSFYLLKDGYIYYPVWPGINPLEDLQKKILRIPQSPDEVLTKSPEIILRGIRFSAKYQLSFADKTEKSIRKNVFLLKENLNPGTFFQQLNNLFFNGVGRKSFDLLFKYKIAMLISPYFDTDFKLIQLQSFSGLFKKEFVPLRRKIEKLLVEIDKKINAEELLANEIDKIKMLFYTAMTIEQSVRILKVHVTERENFFSDFYSHHKFFFADKKIRNLHHHYIISVNPSSAKELMTSVMHEFKPKRAGVTMIR